MATSRLSGKPLVAVRVDGKELGLYARGQPSGHLYAMVLPTGRIAVSRDTTGSALTIETGAAALEHVRTAASPMQLTYTQKGPSMSRSVGKGGVKRAESSSTACIEVAADVCR